MPAADMSTPLQQPGANVHDIREAHNLIRKDDDVMYGDSGYLGIAKRKRRGEERSSSLEG